LTELLTDAGLEITTMQGIAFSPLKGLHLSENMALNYILSARFGGEREIQNLSSS
jgi:2-polyprenyl-6-hydroxyphenyl methylase / 3-demethylubiquinone-9 3-methyltransferase